MTWKGVRRGAKWAVATLIAFELLYLVVANVLLASGAIQHATRVKLPEVDFQMQWKSAFSPWPGRAYVKGLNLFLEDPALQFSLSVGDGRADIALWDLARKRFHATHVTATGVSYRFVARVSPARSNDARVAGFAEIDGFARPPLLPRPTMPQFTDAQIAALWSVKLDRVDSTFSELWLMEFRYEGEGRAVGSMALEPLHRLEVSASRLNFDSGRLTVGKHLVSSTFTAQAEVTTMELGLNPALGLRGLDTVTASLKFDTTVEDLGIAGLYIKGLSVTGTGRLAAHLSVANGKVVPGSTVTARLPRVKAAREGYRFAGDARLDLSMPSGASAPAVHASLVGAATLPLLGKTGIEIDLSDFTADLAFASDRLDADPLLRRTSVVLGEARVEDARPLTALVGTIVPILTPMVLGKGPLIASATAWITPEYTLVRLTSLHLGDAALEGAAVPGAKGWNGAVAGHFGRVPLGLRLQENKIKASLFVSPQWLNRALIDAGIKPDEDVVGQR